MPSSCHVWKSCFLFCFICTLAWSTMEKILLKDILSEPANRSSLPTRRSIFSSQPMYAHFFAHLLFFLPNVQRPSHVLSTFYRCRFMPTMPIALSIQTDTVFRHSVPDEGFLHSKHSLSSHYPWDFRPGPQTRINVDSRKFAQTQMSHVEIEKSGDGQFYVRQLRAANVRSLRWDFHRMLMSTFMLSRHFLLSYILFFFHLFLASSIPSFCACH